MSECVVVLVLVLHDVGPRVSDVQRRADDTLLGVTQRLDIHLLLLLLLFFLLLPSLGLYGEREGRLLVVPTMLRVVAGTAWHWTLLWLRLLLLLLLPGGVVVVLWLRLWLRLLRSDTGWLLLLTCWLCLGGSSLG